MPTRRHDGECHALTHCVSRHFNRRIKLPAYQRPHAVDHVTAKSCEAVGEVVVALSDEQADEPIPQSIDDTLEGWIAMYHGASYPNIGRGTLSTLLVSWSG